MKGHWGSPALGCRYSRTFRTTPHHGHGTWVRGLKLWLVLHHAIAGDDVPEHGFAAVAATKGNNTANPNSGGKE